MSKQKMLPAILSVAMVSAFAVIPSVSYAADVKINLKDEVKRVEQHRAIQQMKQLRPQLEKAKEQASHGLATEPVLTNPNFAGTMQEGEIHAYFVNVTAAGTYQVPTGTVDAMLFDGVTFEPVEPGQTIDAGEYYFVLFGNQGTVGAYDYTLNGLIYEADPTLPNISLKSPADLFTRLTKGAKSIAVSGSSSNVVKAGFQLNYDAPVDLPLNTSFSKSVSVLTGYNELTFFGATSTGNEYFTDKYITAPGVERLAGPSRYDTSAKLAKRMPIVSDTVVIAVGTNFPDALSGGSLAAWEGAPVLLTPSTSMPQVIKDEVKRRGATRAILLGGSDVVSNNVVNELKALGVTQIERKEGANRFDTSASVAKALLESQDAYIGDHSDTAFVVTGMNYADALSATSVAGYTGSPVLLVNGTSLPASIKQVIESKGLKNFYVIGGSSVVSDGIYKQLDNYGNVKRLQGPNRYKTSLAVAEEFTINNPDIIMDWSRFHIAYGGNYPDALSQGPLAAFMGSPLLLTPTAALDPDIDAYLGVEGEEPEAFYISGDTGVVSTNVENRLNSFILP